MKAIKRLGYFGLLLFSGIFLYAHILLGLNPDWAWKRSFEDHNRPEPFRIKTGDRTLYGVDTNEVGKSVLLFIHGSPGSWKGWERYLKDKDLRTHFRLIAIDRPGFGYSNLGNAERDLAVQAAQVALVLERVGNVPVHLVGHSFGGPVAMQMIVDFPSKITSGVMVSASLDPDLEETKTIQKIARWPLIKYLVPPFAYSTNEEIMALPSHLEMLQPRLKEVNKDIRIIHGDADTLVPIENVSYMETHLPPQIIKQQIILRNGNHFIPWEHFLTLKSLLLDLK